VEAARERTKKKSFSSRKQSKTENFSSFVIENLKEILGSRKSCDHIKSYK